MKKIITLVFMSAVLALTSCNDFLDKYPKFLQFVLSHISFLSYFSLLVFLIAAAFT